MESASISSVGQLTIPLFVGTIINWGLLGTLAVQVYIYFLAFPADPRASKLVVTCIVVAELLQTLGDSRNTLRTFGPEWGNSVALDEVEWAWFSVPILGSFIACVGQLFFAWRISVIAKSLYIPAVIAAITAVQLVAGIWTGVEILQAGLFSKLVFSVLRAPVIWLSATALADLVIVIATAYYLTKARPARRGFNPRMDGAISRIIKISVETGLLCAVCALVVLALFVAYNGNNYHLAVCIWLSKVYSNSIMVILNSRAQIGHADAGSTVLASRTTVPDVSFRTSTTRRSVPASGEQSTIYQSEADDKSGRELV